MNLASLLTRTALASATAVAITDGDTETTFADLDASSARAAGVLAALGIGPGDRVGVMLPNVTEFPAVYYGVLRTGGVVVPMNPLLKSREISYYLSDSGASVIVAWHTAAGEVVPAAAEVGARVLLVDPASFDGVLAAATPYRDLAERTGSDTAVILYTSGTTGRPKGAELTHDNLTRNVEVTLDDLLRLGSGDVVFGGLPLFHSFGQTVTLNAAIAAGATLVLLPRFDARQALRLIANHAVTVFAGVPTMYSALLGVADGASFDVSALRVCVSGGAAMPVEIMRRFEDTFDTTVLEGYGLSETSPVASFNKPGTARKPGSIGTPVHGVEMRVVGLAGNAVPPGEVGEIAIRGHNIMKGYWNQPEATAAAIDPEGWFRTGDMGRVDEEGHFFIVDRVKDLIIRGGYNVYPREIEEVLYEHPDVREAAVVGIPHDELGEEVGAAVVLRPGATVTGEQLREFVKNQVAAYKYPRRLWFVDELPKGPTGKILKREIMVPEREALR